MDDRVQAGEPGKGLAACPHGLRPEGDETAFDRLLLLLGQQYAEGGSSVPVFHRVRSRGRDRPPSHTSLLQALRLQPLHSTQTGCHKRELVVCPLLPVFPLASRRFEVRQARESHARAIGTHG